MCPGEVIHLPGHVTVEWVQRRRILDVTRLHQNLPPIYQLLLYVVSLILFRCILSIAISLVPERAHQRWAIPVGWTSLHRYVLLGSARVVLHVVREYLARTQDRQFIFLCEFRCLMSSSTKQPSSPWWNSNSQHHRRTSRPYRISTIGTCTKEQLIS